MARRCDKRKQANYFVVIEGLFASRLAPTFGMHSSVGASLLAKDSAPNKILAMKRKKPRHTDRAFYLKLAAKGL
jgi:hypothetical protein